MILYSITREPLGSGGLSINEQGILHPMVGRMLLGKHLAKVGAPCVRADNVAVYVRRMTITPMGIRARVVTHRVSHANHGASLHTNEAPIHPRLLSIPSQRYHMNAIDELIGNHDDWRADASRRLGPWCYIWEALLGAPKSGYLANLEVQHG